MKQSWTEQEKQLIKWFLGAIPTLPKKPFNRLTRNKASGVYFPFGTIIDPQRHYESLKKSIEQGPGGARASYGALQADLQHLRYFYGPLGEKHRKEAHIID